MDVIFSVIYSWGGGSFSWGDTSKPLGGGEGPECHFFPKPHFSRPKNVFCKVENDNWRFMSRKGKKKPKISKSVPKKKRKRNNERKKNWITFFFLYFYLTVSGVTMCVEGGIVNVKFSNSPKINLLKPVNISAWCGPCVCVCVGHESTTQFFRPPPHEQITLVIFPFNLVVLFRSKSTTKNGGKTCPFFLKCS